MTEEIVKKESALNLESYIENNLPHLKAEEYKYTPLAKEVRKIKFGDSEEKEVKLPEFLVKEALTLVFKNGKLISDIENTDNSFLSVENYKSASQESHADEFSEMNRKFFSSGVNITITKSPEKPLHILHLIDNENGNPLHLVRNKITVKANTEVVLIEDYHYTGSNPSFLNSHLEIDVENNARINTYTLQTKGENNLVFAGTEVKQARDSFYKNVTVTLNGKMVRNNHNISIDDVNCESHLYGFYVPGEGNHFDNHTVADHTREQTYSNELYKGVLGAKGTAVFNGKIYVRPNAQQTNAFQSNGNILLDDSAVLHTKPQLEIWADDVKCSHGCTTGKLDREALFYLRSRGLDRKSAELLLLKAFASDVTKEIEIDAIRESLDTEIINKINRLSK